MPSYYMDQINLTKYKDLKINPPRKRSLDWEQADQFANYLKLRPSFVFKMFKLFGKEKVLALSSWLKDLPDTKNLYGIMLWKLKNE